MSEQVPYTMSEVRSIPDPMGRSSLVVSEEHGHLFTLHAVRVTTIEEQRGNVSLFICSRNSYARHFGPDAVAAAEEDVLGELIKAARNTIAQIEASLLPTLRAYQKERGLVPTDAMDKHERNQLYGELESILARVPQESK